MGTWNYRFFRRTHLVGKIETFFEFIQETIYVALSHWNENANDEQIDDISDDSLARIQTMLKTS